MQWVKNLTVESDSSNRIQVYSLNKQTDLKITLE